MWVLRRTRSLQDGPSQGVVALTLLIALASAFFTGVIGVHPIFGAFMAGLICPHEGGFAIKVTEKVEDLISTLFLPLYFALSGLSTNLGLLNSGIVWGYVIGVIAVAFSGKFIGATLAARVNGLVWRECFTIGSLMSCKGLVELIVLVRFASRVHGELATNYSEHRPSSEDLEHTNFYYLRRYGASYDLCYYTPHISSLSPVVSEKAGSVETG